MNCKTLLSVGSMTALLAGFGEAVVVENGGPQRPLPEAVLFAFDDHSIPLLYRLKLGLIGGRKHGGNPVLRMGNPGDPDAKVVAYYGSVLRLGQELRMWYIGAPRVRATQAGGWPGWGHGRVCYAVSTDGIHWKKPKLGLVAFQGSKNNNLVDLDVDRVVACSVLHDPEDPDPSRRFKMVFESFDVGNNRPAVAYSHDGLRWVQSPRNPVFPPHIEGSGLTKFNGTYLYTGQATRFYPKRVMVTHLSYDFENWTVASVLGFRRDKIPPRSPVFDINAGEQVHMGAALWNRGNVLLGFYGQWHGSNNNDRRFVSMDLGLVVTQDGLHYREPLPDFKMISAAEERDGAHPSLMQGQGFENIGNQTMVWYGDWKDGEVRVASWERDRLGFLEARRDRAGKSLAPAYLVSCPLRLHGVPRIFVNADGLSEESYLHLDLLDEQLRGLPSHSGSNGVSLKKGGLRQPVRWEEQILPEALRRPLRLRLTFLGTRPEDIRVYAIYVSDP